MVRINNKESYTKQEEEATNYLKALVKLIDTRGRDIPALEVVKGKSLEDVINITQNLKREVIKGNLIQSKEDVDFNQLEYSIVVYYAFVNEKGYL